MLKRRQDRDNSPDDEPEGAPEDHGDGELSDPSGTGLPHRASRPPPGALGSIMAGLAEALYGPRQDEPVIVEKAPGAPPPQGLEVVLDPEHPERSRVIIRNDLPPEGPER